MSFKDILLALTSYPTPTPDSSIDRAIALFATQGVHVTGLTFEAETKLVHSTNPFTNMLIDVPQMVAEERAKSSAHAKHLLEYFKASATRQRVSHSGLVRTSAAYLIPDALSEQAKLHDLTIIPFQDGDCVEQWYAETIIFGSGRPTLLLPGPRAKNKATVFETITIAWDYSRPAARALADSLPLLSKAKTVRVVTIINEKDIPGLKSQGEIADHLLKHGIECKFDLVEAEGRSSGTVLTEHVAATGSDLIVMGAYGHSRLKEFILGGATKSMLENPPVPVFLAH